MAADVAGIMDGGVVAIWAGIAAAAVVGGGGGELLNYRGRPCGGLSVPGCSESSISNDLSVDAHLAVAFIRGVPKEPETALFRVLAHTFATFFRISGTLGCAMH